MAILDNETLKDRLRYMARQTEAAQRAKNGGLFKGKEASMLTQVVNRLDELEKLAADKIEELEKLAAEIEEPSKCQHEGYNFRKHGRCCPHCGEFLTVFGD